MKAGARCLSVSEIGCALLLLPALSSPLHADPGPISREAWAKIGPQVARHFYEFDGSGAARNPSQDFTIEAKAAEDDGDVLDK